jgi:hypothetical protein
MPLLRGVITHFALFLSILSFKTRLDKNDTRLSTENIEDGDNFRSIHNLRVIRP